MAKAKCGYCGIKIGKRYCPSLEKIICSGCCAANRLTNILCPENCRYLEHEQYQQKNRNEKELNEEIASLDHSEHNDIFRLSQDAAIIAYNFELIISDYYVKGSYNLTDQKVKETFANLYFAKTRGRELKNDDFTRLVEDIYETNRESFDETLIGKVLLRLIISIKSISGGPFGAYGYLNYLKNNIHPITNNPEGDLY